IHPSLVRVAPPLDATCLPDESNRLMDGEPNAACKSRFSVWGELTLTLYQLSWLVAARMPDAVPIFVVICFPNLTHLNSCNFFKELRWTVQGVNLFQLSAAADF
ncbi:MAG TPA: hypothetical protein VGC15_18270, partial [Acetobacteraceae bacterium]